MLSPRLSPSLFQAILKAASKQRTLFHSAMARHSVRTKKVLNLETIEGFDTALTTCTEALHQGQVIAVPTDTIYGVACLAQNTEAVERIYDIKQRQFEKPVAICVAEVADLYTWGQVTVPNDLLCDLLPGPVTLVFQRTAELNPKLNPQTDRVGIRIPDDKFIRSLCRQCQEPLALTSANVSATQSTLSVQEFECLWPRLAVVCDGGRLGGTVESRLGSTVVDLSQPGVYTVVREGSAYKATVNILAKYGLCDFTNDVR